MNDVKKELLQRLKGQLEDLVKARGWNLIWEVEYPNKDAQFTIVREPNQDYVVTFSFEMKYCNDFVYGIRKTSDDYPDRPELTELLNNNLGQGKVWRGWPWYISYQQDYIDWRKSARPWLEILDEQAILANKLIKSVEEVYRTLDENEGLHALPGEKPM